MAPNPTPPPASADAVAGLTREVDALRRAVRKVADLPARVEQLGLALTQAIDDLSGSARRPDPVRPVSWIADASTEGADQDTVARRLGELADWVGAVYMQYPVAARELPDCWLWHPDMVEELAWLQQAWQAAYDPHTGTITAAGDWHDRYRPGVAHRIRSSSRTCSLENHTGADRRAGHEDAPSRGSVGAIATWWTARRHEQPPLPTRVDLDAAATRLRERRR